MKKNKIEKSVLWGNTLIDMFSKCRDVENAKPVFQKMGKRYIITWTTMVSRLVVNGHCREAFEMYDKMGAQGLKPYEVFIAALSTCTHGGLLDEGKRAFYQMVYVFEIKPKMEHYQCMADLGRVGKLEEAFEFTESMHLEPNVVIWATLLSACKIH